MKIKKYSEKLESNDDEDLKKLQRYYAKKHDLGSVSEDDEDYMSPSELKNKWPTKKEKEEIEPTDDDIRSIESLMKDEGEFEEEFEEEEEDEPIEIKKSNNVKKEGYSEDDLDDDMENVASLIRDLFKYAEIEVQVITNSFDIDIYVFLHKREKIKMLLKVFDTVVKLKKDILPQYESAVELYESKEKWPILQFKFEYKTEKSANTVVVTKNSNTPPPIPLGDGTLSSKGKLVYSEAIGPSSTTDSRQKKLFADDEEVDLGKNDRGSDLPF